MKLAWLTDIHLDFLTLQHIQDFAYKTREQEPDIYLIGGDISTAPLLQTHLRMLDHYWQKPIYFVLGNHDYYKSSIRQVQQELQTFLLDHPFLKWLPQEGVVELSPTTALIGHGLWADGRLGLKEKSTVLLNDYALIEELKYTDQRTLFDTLNELGDIAAQEFSILLKDALARYNHIYALTHVPPFEQATRYNHQLSDPHFLPHFCCFVAGQVIQQIMAEQPDKMLTILSGHTHDASETWISDNIFVKTGGAIYRHPKVQEIITIE